MTFGGKDLTMEVVKVVMEAMTSKRGFTLIELLVVVAIIGILARVGLGGFMFSLKKARDAQRKSDLSNIAKSLEAFANDFGAYPEGDASGNIKACGALAACSWGGEMKATYNGQDVTYMVKLPDDPDTEKNYYYARNGQGYNLYAALENDKDQAYDDSITVVCFGTTECNYKVTESGVSLP